MNPKRYAKQRFVDGTVDAVEFNGRTVGFIGDDSGQTAFVWSQVELRGKSDWRGDAYSMSVPLIDELSSRGVEGVYVFDAETWIDFSDVQDGELLEKDDEFFEDEQDHDQRVVYVESW